MLPEVVEDDSRYVGNDLLSLSHSISGIGDEHGNCICNLFAPFAWRCVGQRSECRLQVSGRKVNDKYHIFLLFLKLIGCKFGPQAAAEGIDAKNIASDINYRKRCEILALSCHQG